MSLFEFLLVWLVAAGFLLALWMIVEHVMGEDDDA